MKEKIRYGIIGTGQMAYGHLGTIKAIPDIEIVAAADISEKSLNAFRHINNDPSLYFSPGLKGGERTDFLKEIQAAPPKEDKSGIKYFTNHKELLELEEVDAVIIASPNFTHVDIVSDALAAGKHVLSEKPAAISFEQLGKLEEAVKKSDKLYQVGLECRYLPVYAQFKKMVDEGKVGNPRLIWCKEFRGPFLHKMENWIMFKEKSGGTFVEKTCHYFDLMTWFSNSTPKKVAAFAGQDVIKDIYGVKPNIVDNGWVIIEYANNVRATLGLSMFSRKAPGLEIGLVGDEAWMECQMHGQTIHYEHYEKPLKMDIDTEPDGDIAKLSHGGGVYFEHLEFIENIRSNRKPLTGIEEAKWSTMIGIAAEESTANGGKPVEF